MGRGEAPRARVARGRSSHALRPLRPAITRALSGATAAVLASLLALAPTAGAAPRVAELVSPPDKNGADIGSWTGQPFSGLTQSGVEQLQVGWFNVSDDGARISYNAVGAFADAVAAPLTTQYVASRTPSGWRTNGVNPPYLTDNPGLDLDEIPFYVDTTSDLRTGLFRHTPRQAPLTPDGPRGAFAYYVRDLPSGPFKLLASGARTLGAVSDDLRRVAYYPYPRDESDPLWEAYVDGQGVVQRRIVSVVGGVPVRGFSGSSTLVMPRRERTISRDGRRIVFNDSLVTCDDAVETTTGDLPTFPCANNHLYVREDGQTTRVVSDAAPGVPADPQAGPGLLFWGADDDVSSVFFTAQSRLTADSTASHDPGDGITTGSYGDLYRYSLDANGGAGELTDLTVDTRSPEGAQVLGVLGMSDDGTRVYFVARSAQLDEGQGVPGQANLYLWDDRGAQPRTTFIATLQPNGGSIGDAMNWISPAPARAAQVTPDGGHLLFTSKNRLTSFDNDGYAQVYLYSADGGRLRCASCFGPQPATGDAFVPQERQLDAAMQSRQGKAVSDDGAHVFFSASGRLLPGVDGNNAIDVYEYEPAGDRLALVSGGRGPNPSFLLGSDRSGENVFFVTRDRLASTDVDDNIDVYDARVGGGFPLPPVPVLCSGDDCRPPLTPPPADEQPASVDSPGEDPLPEPPPASLSVRRATVHGSTIAIALRVGGAGRVVATGSAVRTARRTVPRAGRYTLRTQLTKRARRALARRGRQRVALRLRMVPVSGRSTSTVTRVTVKTNAKARGKR